LKVTGFAAIDAVIETVLAQADVVLALAEVAVPVALAAVLFLFAIEADKFLSHESLCLAIGSASNFKPKPVDLKRELR